MLLCVCGCVCVSVHVFSIPALRYQYTTQALEFIVLANPFWGPTEDCQRSHHRTTTTPVSLSETTTVIFFPSKHQALSWVYLVDTGPPEAPPGSETPGKVLIMKKCFLLKETTAMLKFLRSIKFKTFQLAGCMPGHMWQHKMHIHMYTSTLTL